MKVNHHASSVLIKNRDRFLLSLYDNSYPSFPGYVNVIGGNAPVSYSQSIPIEKRITDKSPKDTLVRELNEEFQIFNRDKEIGENMLEGTIVSHKKRNFASAGAINQLKSAVINGIEYSRDYIGFADKKRTGRKEDLFYLFSLSISNIDQDLVEEVQENISRGLEYLNEGSLKVINLDEIVSGKTKVAWGIGKMMSHILGANFPDDCNLSAIPCPWRETLDSYRAYKSLGIEYSKDPEGIFILSK